MKTLTQKVAHRLSLLVILNVLFFSASAQIDSSATEDDGAEIDMAAAESYRGAISIENPLNVSVAVWIGSDKFTIPTKKTWFSPQFRGKQITVKITNKNKQPSVEYVVNLQRRYKILRLPSGKNDLREILPPPILD